MTGDAQFKKSVLSNGVRVLSESYPQARSVVIGIWVLTGTRDENIQTAGVSHFLEHLVFKGTKKRSSYQIARSLEAVGGELNAYTTKEYTCYYSVSLKEHLKLSIDVLTDLVANATVPKKEFNVEKQVVLQELAMSEEEYAEWIYDAYIEKALPAHPAGYPIVGFEQSLGAMSRRQVLDYYKSRYVGENIIVSVVGCCNHQQLMELVQARLGHLPKKGKRVKREMPRVVARRGILKKKSEQVHILAGFPTVSQHSPLRMESYLVNMLLGGGMTSRLFQQVREKHGLAYSVYSYIYPFSEFSMSFIYAATDAKRFEKAIDLILRELRRLREQGVSKSALNFYRKQVKGGLLLGADDLENRMTAIAITEMTFGRYDTIEDVVKKLDAVSVDSLQRYIDKYVRPEKLGMMILGDLDKRKHGKWLKRKLTEAQ